jgi:hypothetical protein
MVERFNGRIEEVLQSHHFRSGEDLETTLHCYVWLYDQQLPQSALGSKSPLQAMKDWHKLKAQLFRKRPYYLPGCDTVAIPLPPLAEQHRIVAKVDALMALCDRLEAALTTADTTRARLLDALLHKALDPASDAISEAAA